jgi:hypothetical protein
MWLPHPFAAFAKGSDEKPSTFVILSERSESKGLLFPDNGQPTTDN